MEATSVPSATEIAERLISTFPPTHADSLERAIANSLRDSLGPRAAQLAAEQKERQVLGALQAHEQSVLPFDISDSRRPRLVGKQRPRPGDSPEVRSLRERLRLVPSMRLIVHELGDEVFEQLCAALMWRAGATDARVTQQGDEGGIDVYGRLPVRLQDDAIPRDLIRTNVVDKNLLFFGQCKACEPHKRIGRPAIDEFSGQVRAALSHYEGNRKPPAHRVPRDYYRRFELCLPIYFTIGSYSDPAQSAAASRDIVVVDGVQIAELLVHYRAGLAERAGELDISTEELRRWAIQPHPDNTEENARARSVLGLPKTSGT